jgi:hypothetical protein
MAVRMLTYVGLLYQDLIKAAQLPADASLPAVLPIVLYNGSARWQAAEDLTLLVQTEPRALAPYQPCMRYLLLDERRYHDSELSQQRNLVAAVFRLENSSTHADLDAALGSLTEWLSSAEHQELRRAFAVWIGKVILARFPGMETTKLDELQEIRAEVAERFHAWGEQLKREGHEKGLTRGYQEGEAHLLLRQLRKRFGDLPASVTARVTSAPAEQLEAWGERLLEEVSLSAVFADI